MAIKNNITESNSQYGIAFSNVYYRIVNASVSREPGSDPKFSVIIDLSRVCLIITYGRYKRNRVSYAYTATLDQINASSGDAFLDKCYSWVMAQADFEGSTAV